MTNPKGKIFTFAKVVTVLAIVFILSLGMCGLSAAISSASSGQNDIYAVTMVIGLVGMVVSGLAVFVTLPLWLIVALASGSSRKAAEPQKPYDGNDKMTGQGGSNAP
jgi:quinol-cytochrome oxidoreductase complex cytochrome b subunit